MRLVSAIAFCRDRIERQARSTEDYSGLALLCALKLPHKLIKA